MTGPRETLEILLDLDTTAQLEIQIHRQPTIPTPLERPTVHIPTARELEAIATLLHQRKHTFPPQ